MFSRLPKPATNTVLRLTLLYTLIFIIGSLICFFLAYDLLSDAVRAQDREALTAKMREFATVAQKRGLDGLRAAIASQDENGDLDEFFLRLVDRDGKTLAILDRPEAPEIPAELGAQAAGAIQWSYLSGADEDEVSEIAGRRLTGEAVLLMGRDAGDRERLLRDFRKIFATIMIPVALLGVLAGFFLARRILSPLKALIRTMRMIDSGRMDARAPTNASQNELNELARLFNSLFDRIHALIAGMRETLDNVAHDLRTPSSRILAGVENALQRGGGAPELREALMDCAEETRRMVGMLNTLMDIAEAEHGAMALRLECIAMAEAAGDVAELYRYLAEEKGIVLELDAAPDAIVKADPDRLRQVLANLVDNAVKYAPPGGRVGVGSRREGDAVVTTVWDDGEGVAEKDRPRIFDRLYRADKSRSRRGLGLGLSLVRAVVEAHGGDVRVESRPGLGGVFVFTLPVGEAEGAGV